MKILMIAGVLLVLFAGLSAYVRLAPVDLPMETQKYTSDTELAGGFVAVREFTEDVSAVLARLTQVALATPRTKVVAQDPLTFVTRSRGFGFPDVTQVTVMENTLTIHAHSVYGKSDLGVNKARVLAWLDALGPL